MLRTAAILAIAFVPVVFAADITPHPTRSPDGVDDPIPVSPVLLVRTSGASLLGDVASNITVHSDGFATRSVSDPSTGDGTFQTASLTSGDVLSLQQALVAAGAFSLGDQAAYVQDVPMTTMTVFEPGPDGSHHTFSFFVGDGEYEGVATILTTLLQRHFPTSS